MSYYLHELKYYFCMYYIYILIKINENKKVNNKVRISLIENKFIKKNIFYKYNR